jgi:PAS domain S-box-containing protein
MTDTNRTAVVEASERDDDTPLLESEFHHRLLFEHNPLPMMVYDRATLGILAVSNSAVENYGFTRKEFASMTLRDLTPPEDLEAFEQFFEQSGSVERLGTLSGARRQRCKDGRIMDIDMIGDDLEISGRACRIILCQDVTERNRATAELVQAREQLARSAAEHQLLFERNPQPLLVYDSDTLAIVAVSDAATASMGYTREEFMELTLFDIAPEEDHAPMRYFLNSHPAGSERLGLQLARPRHHLAKDGTVIDVEVTSDDLVLSGRACRVCLCLDVTERNRASDELAIARDQAVEASNMKSAFLANMSHEIRTPMNGVIGMTELLLGMELGEEQREAALQIARSGEQMLSIINDILDISKIETGHLELDVTDFDLHEGLRNTCAIASAQAKAKGLFLDLHISDQVPARMRGDGRRIHQIVLNLVSNAIKFTAEGSVTVRLLPDGAPSAEGTPVRIEVQDSGIGIDPGKLDRMFEPFTQADVSTTRLYGGTGLGLAIARELVELMDGTISAESEPGKGSTFQVELVLASPLVEDAPASAGRDVSVVASWARPPEILVAEDSQINQIVAARSLERCGCRVDVVSNGADALQAIATRRYDAVLMDCQMPGMDGYEATRELRAREIGQDLHIPVVAMTAQAMEGDRERCLAAGMDDFVTKPMRFEELNAVLRRWIPTDSARHEITGPQTSSS